MSKTLDFNTIRDRLQADNWANALDILNDAVKNKNGLMVHDQGVTDTYFLWDADHEKYLQVDYHPDTKLFYPVNASVGSMRKELKDFYVKQTEYDRQDLFLDKKPLSGWDKFVSFFGFKTDTIRYNERIDRAIRLKEKGDAYVRDRMMEAGITDEKLLPPEPSAKDRAVESLSGQELKAYLETGNLPQQEAPAVKTDVVPRQKKVDDVPKQKKVDEGPKPQQKQKDLSPAGEAIETLTEYTPKANMAYDHMMHSIADDNTLAPKEKGMLRIAAYMLCKHYYDGLTALKENNGQPKLSGDDKISVDYLSNCSSATLLEVCKDVAGQLPTELKEGESVFDKKIDYNKIVDNVYNRFGRKQKNDEYSTVKHLAGTIKFPTKEEDVKKIFEM